MKVEVIENKETRSLKVRAFTDGLKGVLHCYSNETRGVYNAMETYIDWDSKGQVYLSLGIINLERHNNYSVSQTFGDEDHFAVKVTKRGLSAKGFSDYSRLTLKKKNEILSFLLDDFEYFCEESLKKFIVKHAVSENREQVKVVFSEMLEKIFDFFRNSETPLIRNMDRSFQVN